MRKTELRSMVMKGMWCLVMKMSWVDGNRSQVNSPKRSSHVKGGAANQSRGTWYSFGFIR